MDETPRRPTRIGAWRLLDLAQASISLRSMLFGGGPLPEYGPPDVINTRIEPDEELPGSNIAEHEQRSAIERERTRRWLAARSES